jgi:D-arabinose 5-phosphate isomerase GutQ
VDLVEDAKEVIRRESRMLEQVAEQLGESFSAAVDLLVGCQGHVITSGVGTTGMIARRFAHLLCNVGCPALFLHAGDSLHGSSGAIRPEDVLFLLTKSGETTETCMLAKLVVERNTPIITLTANPDSTAGQLSTVIIKVETEKEVDPYEGLMSVGSTLAAGAICDALVFAVMWAKGTPQQQFVKGHPGGIIAASMKDA